MLYDTRSVQVIMPCPHNYETVFSVDSGIGSVLCVQVSVVVEHSVHVSVVVEHNYGLVHWYPFIETGHLRLGTVRVECVHVVSVALLPAVHVLVVPLDTSATASAHDVDEAVAEVFGQERVQDWIQTRVGVCKHLRCDHHWLEPLPVRHKDVAIGDA